MPLSQSENLTTCIGVGGRGCPFKQLVSNLVRETGTTLLETRWGDITSSVLESLILRVVILPFALPCYFSNFFSGFALFQFNPFTITCILFSYSGGWRHLQLFFMIQLCVEWCKEWWRSYTCRFVNLPPPLQFITNAFSEDKQLPWYLAPFSLVPSHFALWSGLNTSV